MAAAQDSVSSEEREARRLSAMISSNEHEGAQHAASAPSPNANRPLILITDSNSAHEQHTFAHDSASNSPAPDEERRQTEEGADEEEEQVEEIDGIRYRIVAAVTKPAQRRATPKMKQQDNEPKKGPKGSSGVISSMRRKSSAFVSNLLTQASANFVPDLHSRSNHELGSNLANARPRRLSIYEMTKSPPPETSLEIYLSERRRSSTISSKQVQQQLEQQSTFETNYCQRQQYFKDLNQKLINHDKKLLNVVANRGQIHRHSVDIAQLPLHLAQAKASRASSVKSNASQSSAKPHQPRAGNRIREKKRKKKKKLTSLKRVIDSQDKSNLSAINQPANEPIDGAPSIGTDDYNVDDDEEEEGEGEEDDDDDDGDETEVEEEEEEGNSEVDENIQEEVSKRLVAIRENKSLFVADSRSSFASRTSHGKKSQVVIRKFQKLDQSELSSTPAPDVKIGQRVAYKEYYGNEFGTIRWIGRVPQICPDWTVGVEFDNAIGEGDGSLNGRRYFIAKDCFAKFLPLNAVALVDQHVGRPEPGTMISVMSAAVRPGQMISIQRVSTVHVQHCFLNAPHRRPGADILAVNTRLHCQCPNCGPCAHVIKPPRTQRLARTTKNATHMCQFSTYTCCGMESQEETMCTYSGNKVISLPPPATSSSTGLPPIGNSWIEGAGYLTNLQAHQSKLMPEEYKLGAAPEDIGTSSTALRRSRKTNRSITSSRRGSGRHHHHHGHHKSHSRSRQLDTVQNNTEGESSNINLIDYTPSPVPTHDCQFKQTDDGRQEFYVEEGKGALVDCDESSSKASPKSRVVYRDSIENRYLFPTDDDRIDSTLEAELENLSQARYGHSSNSNRSRTNGVPKNILKSLRSLVSCLSAGQTNNSDFDDRRSIDEDNYDNNNTLKYSEHYEVNEKGNYTSMPCDQVMEYRARMNHCSTLIEEKENLSLTCSDSQTLSSDKQFHYQKHQEQENDQYKSNVVNGGPLVQYSSSDCGFSSASQNSINFLSSNNQALSGTSPIISSSDDQVYRRIIARLMNSNSIKGEDLLKLKEVLFDPLEYENNCCFDSKSNGLNKSSSQSTRTNTTTKIDQIIADVIRNSYLNNEQRTSPTATTCCGHMSALTNSSFCSRNQYGPSHLNEMNPNSHERTADISSGYSFNHHQHHCLNESKSNSRSMADSSSTTDTMSIQDSYNSTVFAGSSNTHELEGRLKGELAKSIDNSNLPKAFELKLTLSINPEKAIDDSNADKAEIDTQTSNNRAKSSLNINIIPTKKEDGLQNEDTTLNNVNLSNNIISVSSLQDRQTIDC